MDIEEISKELAAASDISIINDIASRDLIT